MTWSPQARAAAAAARKAKGGGRPKRTSNAQRAVGVRWGAEMHGQVGSTKLISKPASAKAGKNASALHEIARFNQHGPIGGKEPHLKASPYPLSRPQTGLKKPPPAKKPASKPYQSDFAKWKSTWGLGAG